MAWFCRRKSSNSCCVLCIPKLCMLLSSKNSEKRREPLSSKNMNTKASHVQNPDMALLFSVHRSFNPLSSFPLCSTGVPRGIICRAHRLLHHSTQGARVIREKKKKKVPRTLRRGGKRSRPRMARSSTNMAPRDFAPAECVYQKDRATVVGLGQMELRSHMLSTSGWTLLDM